MRFYTEFSKSVTKDAIIGHPDLRIEKIELGEFLIDKYDNECMLYFDKAGNLDTIQHQDNRNWFILYTLVKDLDAQILLDTSIDELIEDENKFNVLMSRDTRFVIEHCKDADWEEYSNNQGIDGVSSSQLRNMAFEDMGKYNWKAYFSSNLPKRLYSFSNADYKVVCYKTLKPESMESLMYSYLLKEMNKFELYNEQDEGCYIDNEDELGCGKQPQRLYLINNSADQTLGLDFQYDREFDQFVLREIDFRYDNDRYIFVISFHYQSFFELIEDDTLSRIVELWLKPNLFREEVIREFKMNENVFVSDKLPF